MNDKRRNGVGGGRGVGEGVGTNYVLQGVFHDRIGEKITYFFPT